MEDFNGLDKDIESSPKRWRKIVESGCPEKERLPQDWKNKSSLQKLIIFRALRPDRMTYTLRLVIDQRTFVSVALYIKIFDHVSWQELCGAKHGKKICGCRHAGI